MAQGYTPTSVYLGVPGQAQPQQNAYLQKQTSGAKPETLNAPQPPSSESGSAEAIPAPAADPVKLSVTPPRTPTSVYLPQPGYGGAQSQMARPATGGQLKPVPFSQLPPGAAGTKPSPKPAYGAASAYNPNAAKPAPVGQAKPAPTYAKPAAAAAKPAAPAKPAAAGPKSVAAAPASTLGQMQHPAQPSTAAQMHPAAPSTMGQMHSPEPGQGSPGAPADGHGAEAAAAPADDDPPVMSTYMRPEMAAYNMNYTMAAKGAASKPKPASAAPAPKPEPVTDSSIEPEMASAGKTGAPIPAEQVNANKAEFDARERARAEKQRLDREARHKMEKEKAEREKAEKAERERERAEKEKAEKEKAEKEKAEKEREKAEKAEKERMEREKADQDKLHGSKTPKSRLNPAMNEVQGEKRNITLEPERLTFTAPFDSQQHQDLKLVNHTTDIIQYKIMATNPKHYRVKNKQGSLKPGDSTVAVVRLEPLKDAQRAQHDNHRIMVQTAVSRTVHVDKDFWREVDGRKNRVQFNRIPVKLLMQGQKEDEVEDVAPPIYDTEQNIVVEPENELTFRGPFDEVVTSAICVVNNTDMFMYLKVLVTNPEPFRVRPNYACINPRAMQVLAALLEPVGNLAKLEKKKNKFMIEYTDSDTNTTAPEQFWKKCTKFQSVKLQAIFVKE